VIQHIVLLKFKPGTTDAQIEAAFTPAQQLVDEIDGVERVTLGRNRGQSDHGYTHALIVKLDDNALSSYLAHPVRHKYIAEVLDPIEEQRIEIDVPEDAHLERPRETKSNWQWNRPPSASAAAAALRWEEAHPDG
jgi:Stress responsive A/B Barrel Domain